MSRQRRALVDAVYASFALQQPLSLEELAEAAPRRELQMTHTQTPLWFAAAVHEPNLMRTAPELLGMSEAMESEEWSGLAGTDLVHLYAPELDSTVATPVRASVPLRARPPAEPAAESMPEPITPHEDDEAARGASTAEQSPDEASSESSRLLEELFGIED